MGDFLRNEPCPKCSKTGHGKSLSVYTDGVFCNECEYRDNTVVEREGHQQPSKPSKLLSGDVRGLPKRCISEETCRKFGYKIGKYSGKIGKSIAVNQPVHIASHYDHRGEEVLQKLRTQNKDFPILGDTSKLDLYGKWLWEPNEKISITITEGEIDALSVYEAQGDWPVVSLPLGAQSAEKYIKKNLQWLNKFKHVILCFDQDEAGRKATEVCKQLFEPGKLKIATLPLKDANEMLTSGRIDELRKCILRAKEVRPEGIIKLSDIQEEDVKAALKPGIPIKFKKLHHMLNGLQKQALYTIVARAKSGKTTLTKEMALDLVHKGYKVGLLYLEEDATLEGLSIIAMEKKIPQWKFNDKMSESKVFFKEVMEHKQRFEDTGLYLYNHKGVLDPDSVYNAVSYMSKALKCDVIVLDNVSISIAGSDQVSNERKMIDKMVFKLVQLINNTGVTVLTVVHLNQRGEGEEKISRRDVFGSGAFLKFSRALIGLDRKDNNVLELSVLANRTKGIEGTADILKYNTETGRLEEIDYYEDTGL